MTDLIKGDYVTHWEDGIGKVVRISADEIAIDVFGVGEKKIPIAMTKHYKKVAPNGFIANIYSSLDHVLTLIAEKSPEIIKLLILDEVVPAEGVKISKIKTLLGGDEKNSDSWRKKLGLVKDLDWKKWWATVSKKIKNDPWLDLSVKGNILLRESPVDSFSSIFKKFDEEKDPDKKMALCRQLIHDKDALRDPVILEDLENYLDGLLNVPLDGETLGQVVSAAVEMEQKGAQITSFHENAKALCTSSLLRGRMSLAARSKVYSYLCKLKGQDVYDHLSIFLISDEKLREAIHKKLAEKKFQEIIKKSGDRRITLNDDQVDFVNATDEENRLKERIASLISLVKNGMGEEGIQVYAMKAIQDFLASVLVVANIDQDVKNSVAKHIIAAQLKGVVYPFMHSIRLDKNKEPEFFKNLLLLVGASDVERAILDEATALERPEVFTSAVKVLIDNESVSDEERLNILSKVDGILSSLMNNGCNIEELRIAITRIGSGLHLGYKGITSLDSAALIKLVTNRSSNFQDRADAVDILIRNRDRESCLAVASILLNKISVTDFGILRRIVDAYPEDLITDEMMTRIIDGLAENESDSDNGVSQLFKNNEVIRHFAVFIVEQDAEWHRIHGRVVDNILCDQYLCEEVVRCWLDRYILSTISVKDIWAIIEGYLKGYPQILLQVVREKYLMRSEDMQSQLSNLTIMYDHKIAEIMQEKSDQITGAIDKVSQRYEEHLKSLVDLPQELSLIRDALENSARKSDSQTDLDELTNKLIVIKEKITHVLRVVELIDRE